MKFEDLSAKFIEYEDSRKQYIQRCISFAVKVASHLQHVTGAPEKYRIPMSDHPKVMKYIELRQVTDSGTLKEVSYHGDAITFEDDGFFTFGVSIALERSPNSFPKYPFASKVRCKISSDRITTEVVGKRSTFEAEADQKAAEATASAVLNAISSALDQRFEDFVGPATTGFDLTGRQ